MKTYPVQNANFQIQADDKNVPSQPQQIPHSILHSIKTGMCFHTAHRTVQLLQDYSTVILLFSINTNNSIIHEENHTTLPSLHASSYW